MISKVRSLVALILVGLLLVACGPSTDEKAAPSAEQGKSAATDSLEQWESEAEAERRRTFLVGKCYLGESVEASTDYLFCTPFAIRRSQTSGSVTLFMRDDLKLYVGDGRDMSREISVPVDYQLAASSQWEWAIDTVASPSNEPECRVRTRYYVTDQAQFDRSREHQAQPDREVGEVIDQYEIWKTTEPLEGRCSEYTRQINNIRRQNQGKGERVTLRWLGAPPPRMGEY